MRGASSIRLLLCGGAVSVAAMLAGVTLLPSSAADAAPSRLRSTAMRLRPPASTTTSTTTVTAPVPTAPRIGLSYGDTLPNASAADLGATLDDAKAVGASWIRVDLGWDRIQPVASSSFDWSSFDRTLAAARARGLSVLPILAYTPAWARTAGCPTPKCAPSDPAVFAAFARAAAVRYAPLGVHTWEVWNEPNLQQFWQPAPDATQYVALLTATARAVRAADASASVLSGGLSPAPTAGGNISQLDFLTAFCQLGGAGLVDAVGYHPYSYPVLPGYDAPWNAWAQMAMTTSSFESILATYGAAAKPIWITEYGAPTNGPGAGATLADLNLTNHPDHVDEALQAQMATDSVSLARRSTFIGALFWHSYRDLGTDPSTIENFFGLRRKDGTVKPAWSALRQAATGA